LGSGETEKALNIDVRATSFATSPEGDVHLGAEISAGLTEPARSRWWSRVSPRTRKVLTVVVSAGVVALIFLGIFPSFASYSNAWSAMKHITVGWWILIAIVAFLDQAATPLPWIAVLPRLRRGQAFMQVEATTAVADTVPAGGAVALGLGFAMFRSFGLKDVEISAAVLVTGVWNTVVRLAIPVVALALLFLAGQGSGGFLSVIFVSAGAIVAIALGGWAAFHSQKTATMLGRLADWPVNQVRVRRKLPVTNRVELAMARFHNETVGIVRRRWLRLSGAVLVTQAILFVLVLVCVRSSGIGGRVGFVDVLVAFSISRFAGALPITPGGLGTVDLAFTSTLVGFGAPSSQALAAALLWRLTTYALPIALGTVTYLMWRAGIGVASRAEVRGQHRVRRLAGARLGGERTGGAQMHDADLMSSRPPVTELVSIGDA
jgi:uncharacterized protein (TIRG00374 family)